MSLHIKKQTILQRFIENNCKLLPRYTCIPSINIHCGTLRTSEDIVLSKNDVLKHDPVTDKAVGWIPEGRRLVQLNEEV